VDWDRVRRGEETSSFAMIARGDDECEGEKREERSFLVRMECMVREWMKKMEKSDVRRK
jgi:hypothetical protein